MWRTEAGRVQSAARRLKLAKQLWQWQPHPSQARFFSSAAQVRVAACGRRWGKTEALSLDIATLALDEPGCRQLIVAPTDVQARLLGNEVLSRLLSAWDWRGADGLPHPLVRGWELAVQQQPSLSITLTSANPLTSPHPETILHFRTSGRDGRSLRGLWAHRVIVDEAARVPDTVLTDVLLPMLTDKGGDYVLASSPNGKRSAFYRLFARAASGSEDAQVGCSGSGITYAAHQFPTHGNPYLDLAFLHSQREEMGEAMFAQEYDAQFLDTGGAVFRDNDIEAAICTDPRVTLENGQLVSAPLPGWLYTIGIDWSRKLDFTVVAVLDATETPARLVYLQRWQGTGWEAQIEAVAGVVAKFDPWAVLADGNSIGDPPIEGLKGAVRRMVHGADSRPTVSRTLAHQPEGAERGLDRSGPRTLRQASSPGLTDFPVPLLPRPFYIPSHCVNVLYKVLPHFTGRVASAAGPVYGPGDNPQFSVTEILGAVLWRSITVEGRTEVYGWATSFDHDHPAAFFDATGRILTITVSESAAVISFDSRSPNGHESAFMSLFMSLATLCVALGQTN